MAKAKLGVFRSFSALTLPRTSSKISPSEGRPAISNFFVIYLNTMSDLQKDQEFLEYVVKTLVDNPQDVKVNRKVDEMGVLMTLDVNPLDMGKIIGRQGNTAKAIRTLLRVVGMKNNARVNLKINEPEGSTRQPSTSAAESVDQAMADLKF